MLAHAPAIAVQVPGAVQPHHWYANAIGKVPVHVPQVAVSVCPTLAQPEIVGTAVFTGAQASTLQLYVAGAETLPSESVARALKVSHPLPRSV